MQLPWSILKNLPVYTESGQKLGLVEGVTVDSQTHGITHYEIKPATILAGLLGKSILVHNSQVASLTNEKMTVKDSVSSALPVSGDKKTRLASVHSEIHPAEAND